MLFNIFCEKYINVKINNYQNKSIKYITKGSLESQRLVNDIYNKLKNNSTTVIEKDITGNSIMSLFSQLFFPGEFGKIARVPIRIIRSFFIEVFIYYQNKNSPLMKYIKEAENYAGIPFTYELSQELIKYY